MGDTIRLGTRGSTLARWQTDHVRDLLQRAWPERPYAVVVFSTRGDRVLDTPLPLIGGKGLFTAELEQALREGHIDLAVHSLKDLPTQSPDKLTIGAVPQRARVADVLVSRKQYTLETLPRGATIGTSSTRRAAQLCAFRPDLKIVDIRGNVDTRITKALNPDGPYDAIVLAYAGLERLGRLDVVSQVLPLEVMLPAPGQGALAVQCREESESLALLAPINHDDTQKGVTAERAFLAGLGGGCAVPVAAHAQVNDETVMLTGRVLAGDGSAVVEVSDSGVDARQLGESLAQQALERGAAALLGMH